MPSAAAEVRPNPKISPRPSVAHHPNSAWGPPGLRLLHLENVAWLAPVSQPDLARSQTDSARSQPDSARSQNDPARSQPDPARSQPDPARSQNNPARSQNNPARSQNDPARSQTDPARSQNDSARPPNPIAAPFPEATPEISPSTNRFPAPAPQGGTPIPNRETAPGGSRAGVEWEEKRIAVIGWNGRQ